MEEPQEATFYQDEGISSHLLPHYLYDKNELQLNLHPVATEPKFNEGLRKNATPAELRSPDFGILKLGSPELEKMIMSLQGSVTTSSTPCSFYNTTSNASIGNTNESYARGFTETLQDLHDKQSTGESLIDLADNAADINDPFLGQHTFGNMLNQQQKQDLQPTFKIEQPQAQIMTDPGVLQPIDLEIQEVVKRERKKQRNRVASSKCRKRKLEREARLENRVKDLKERNIELNAVANALKQQVCDLKQRVMDHVGEGCQIMLVHQSQLSTS
ncbi:Transcription factor AP-1 [Exaiptasia diaphana]|nr:Transcription factor AP-1 [Exaiptasia diaphana]